MKSPADVTLAELARIADEAARKADAAARAAGLKVAGLHAPEKKRKRPAEQPATGAGSVDIPKRA